MNNFATRLIKQIAVISSFCIFSLSGLFAQTIDWASNQGDLGSDFIWESDIDSDGNMYTTGMFYDDIDLDPGAGASMFSTAGQQDIFVSKLDDAGNFVWGHTFGNSLRDRSNAIAVGDDGSVYIAGYFEDQVDFDPGAGVFNLTAVNLRDCFVLKLDTNGDFVWVTQFGGTNDGEINGIDVDANGNVYVTGVFRDTYNFDMSGTAELTAEGARDIFITKLDNAGDYVWARSIGGTSDEFNTGMTTDNNGAVYITGYFNGTVEMDPGAGSTVLTTGGGQNGFLLKLDTDGIFEWVNQLYSGTNSRGTTITVDESNNVVLGGRFDGTVEFDYPTSSIVETALAPNDFFIMKMNEMGNVTWVNHYENTGTAEVEKLTTNNLEEIYATGSFSGDINFDIVGGTAPYTGDGPSDLFVLRLGEDGSYLYEDVATGPGNNQGQGISVNDSWEIYIGGYFSDDVTFSDASVLSSVDLEDGLIYKLSSFCIAPDAPTLTETANDLCPNNTTTIDITAGNLNDGTNWVWYSDSMFTDSIFAGTSFTTPSLTDTITYYVRGEGACEVNSSEITINVGDNTGPVITVAPITENTIPGACYYQSENLTIPAVTDDCGVDTIYNDAPLLLFAGVNTITWTAVDINGNTSQETQEITVVDNENPDIDAPADVTVSADVNCEATGVALGTPLAVDNCTVDNITNDAPATFPLGNTVVTWTVTDEEGNIGTDTQTVTVEDDTNPTIVSLPADIAVNNDAGVCEATVTWTAPTADDNCPGSSIAQTAGDPNGSTFPVGVSTIEYTATDAAGNETSESFTITVTDNENPTITAPADITVSADNYCNANPSIGNATTADNCGVANVSNDAPATFALGITTVTWTVTDINGNINTATQDVEVIDDINPTILNLPADRNVNVDPGSCSAVVNWIAPTVIDNCVAPSINQTGGLASGSLFPIGSTIIEYTALDGSGNTTVETFTVTVIDDEAPTITAPTDVTVSADNNCQATGVALGTPTTNDNCGVASVTNDAPTIFSLGVTTVTWTVTDNAGNITTDTQDVTVTDDENPNIIAPSDITVSADASCQATVASLGTPVTSDNCSILSVTNDAPATYPLGVTTVTWTIEDGSGNISTDTQDVIVEDDTNPVIVDLPLDIAVSNDAGLCEAVVSWTEPTTTDNCTGATISQTGGVANGDPFPVGVNTVEYTALDGSGNTTVETFTVTVTDDEDPTITAPTDVTVSADNNCQATGVALGASTTSDNCGVASVTNDAPTIYSIGVTTVTWTVTDDAGNISTDTQDVIVEDDTNPVIVDLPLDIAVSNDAGLCEAVVSWTEPTTTDNCTGATISQTGGVANGDPFPVGVNTVEYTALDGSGNSTVETFTVTVTDDEDPTITSPTDVTVSADNNCQATGVALGTPVTNDNCGVASVTNDAPSIFSLGVTTVTWTVTDDAGNITTDMQDVTVEDDQNPNIIAPSDITVSADASCQATVASLGTPVTSDNCSILSVTNDAPATYPLGVTTVTWTIEDGSGNISTDTQDVIVEDDSNPVIVDLPADIAVSNDAGVCEAVVSWTEPTTTDNCTGATISQTGGVANGDPFPVGVNTVEYTAIDGSGNEVVETFTVTVTDDEDPTITAPTDVTVSADNNCQATGVALGTSTTSDNCGVASVTNDAPTIYSLGVTTVTWTVTDDAGNITTDTQDVTVEDDEDPTIIAPADITVSADASCEATVANLGTAVTSDNCSILSVTNDAPATYPLGVTTVTWAIEDGSGNISTDTQDVIVEDDTNPVIVDLPADIAVSNDAGVCEAVVSWTEPTTTDNCTGATISQTGGVTNGDPFPVGVNTVEYTTIDGSGNEVVETFTVIVTDDEDPTIAAPADLNVPANNFCTAFGVVLGTAITNDNCSVASVTNDGPAIYSLGSTVVTWTVTDSSGNTATATQNVTVIDDQDPTVVAPADITLTADTNCEATVSDLGSPISSDNCNVVSVTDDAPAIFPLGVTTVTWTVTDGSGNTSTDTQDIIVIDEIDPTIVDLPADISVNTDAGSCDAVVTWTDPTTDDNCSGATITQTNGAASGSAFPLGVSTIEYTATDGSGNEVTGSFTITVSDDEDPTIVAPADTLVEANHFCTALNVVLDGPTVDDNCTVASVDNDAPPVYPIGNTTVTWTVTDAAGNTAVATQVVTVADSTAPTITAPLPVTAYVDDSCEVEGIDLGTPTFDDNCGVDTVYNNALSSYSTGTHIITWAAEDEAGNISFSEQELTVLDTISPTPDLKDTTITLSPDGPIELYGSDIDLGSTDNCGMSEVVLMQELYDCDDLGVNEILVEVIDIHGNVRDTYITVTVVESGIDLDFDMIDDACDDDVNTTVVDVPSGFTPNGDGINDLFIIPGLSGYTTIRLTIFNRYGNLVYENDNYENDWDGTSSKNGGELPDGTYFYVLELDGGERYNGYVQINRTLK